MILWTVACKSLPSMGSSRQEYWNGLPLPPPGVLPDPGIELSSPVSSWHCRQILYLWSTRETRNLESMMELFLVNMSNMYIRMIVTSSIQFSPFLFSWKWSSSPRSGIMCYFVASTRNYVVPDTSLLHFYFLKGIKLLLNVFIFTWFSHAGQSWFLL